MTTHIDDLNAICLPSENATNAEQEGDRFEKDLGADFKFKKKDLSKLMLILGIDVLINKGEGTIKLSAGTKILQLADKYNMMNTKSSNTLMRINALETFKRSKNNESQHISVPYSVLVRSLLWIASIICLDIAFSVHVLSRSLQKPQEVHWIAAK